ncbi:MAG: DUF2442 domain-containing protein [Lachnospiraceae bacterium]|nr:DUF2442 domain-containing protein [Candidatus Merdinaster equi]
MKIYEIIDGDSESRVGALLYYENAKAFIIELEKNLDEWSAPLLFTSFIKKNIYTIPKDVSLLWVKERIIPSGRQNLGDILKNHKLKEYDEIRFLELSLGRCSQDSLYIKKVDELPAYVKERQQRLVTEVVALGSDRLLVFFGDNTTRVTSLAELKNNDDIDKVLRNKKLFNSVKVGVGGYSITFNNSIDIQATDLYSTGSGMPLKADDFISFVSRNICDTTKACEILECSRQNIAYLIKRKDLEPISEDVKGNLYTKGDIEKNKW